MYILPVIGPNSIKTIEQELKTQEEKAKHELNGKKETDSAYLEAWPLPEGGGGGGQVEMRMNEKKKT